MNKTLSNPVFTAAATAVVAIVTAAFYAGSIVERINQIDARTANGPQEPMRAEEPAPEEEPAADAIIRTPGPEMRFSNGGRWGAWSDPVYCQPNHYVCGLRQRVEAPIEGDDTAMNAIAFYCCPLNP